MYPAEYAETPKKESFSTGLSEKSSEMVKRIPTLDGSLDRYFDLQMEAIISEWGLITAHHLAVFERRIETVSQEIDKLEGGRKNLEERAAAIDSALKEMEGS
jgi:polyhydroxyalkanoate synthesis regulator phasin